MEPFTWSDKISVGSPAMDAQHMKLIELLNALAFDANPGVVFDTVMRMFDYASVHFKEEEALLARIGYRELERQKSEHHAFLSKTTELAGQSLGDPATSVKIATYLTTWLLHHIMEEDMKYKPFIPESEKS